MPLFTVSQATLQPVAQSKFSSEKALQQLVEKNLDTVFKCRLVASAQGKRLGRPRIGRPLIDVPGGTVRAAAAVWGVSKTTAAKWIAKGRPL
jgi:hypothetical protein